MHFYPEGEIVAISATPSSSYLFDYWEGDVADPNAASTTVTMDGDKSVMAHMTPIAEPTCVTIQRGSFGTVADTSMWELVPNAAYGAAVRISTGDRMHPALGPGETRSLLHFDLGFLPPGVAIQSATFGIYSETASGEPVSIYRVTEGWSLPGRTERTPIMG
jgi:hypothetical protein